jgi:hypothetical protein
MAMIGCDVPCEVVSGEPAGAASHLNQSEQVKATKRERLDHTETRWSSADRGLILRYAVVGKPQQPTTCCISKLCITPLPYAWHASRVTTYTTVTRGTLLCVAGSTSAGPWLPCELHSKLHSHCNSSAPHVSKHRANTQTRKLSSSTACQT